MILTLFCLATTPILDLPLSQQHKGARTYTVEVEIYSGDAGSFWFVYRGQNYTIPLAFCAVKRSK